MSVDLGQVREPIFIRPNGIFTKNRQLTQGSNYYEIRGNLTGVDTPIKVEGFAPGSQTTIKLNNVNLKSGNWCTSFVINSPGYFNLVTEGECSSDAHNHPGLRIFNGAIVNLQVASGKFRLTNRTSAPKSVAIEGGGQFLINGQPANIDLKKEQTFKPVAQPVSQPVSYPAQNVPQPNYPQFAPQQQPGYAQQPVYQPQQPVYQPQPVPQQQPIPQQQPVPQQEVPQQQPAPGYGGYGILQPGQSLKDIL